MEDRRDAIDLRPEIRRFIEKVAAFYEGYGIPRIGGRMFGLLLVTSSPLSAQTLSEVLQASRSSISTNVRGLIGNGWVERVTFSGDRTEYFRFSPTAWEQVLEHRGRGLGPLLGLVEEARQLLPKDHPARDQLDDMGAWVKLQIDSYEAMIEKWRRMQAGRRRAKPAAR